MAFNFFGFAVLFLALASVIGLITGMVRKNRKLAVVSLIALVLVIFLFVFSHGFME